MYKNKMLEQYKLTFENSPRTIYNTNPSIYSYKRYVDNFEDEFETVAGVKKMGFAVLDNSIFKIYKDNNEMKMYKSKDGHYYLCERDAK